MPSIAKVRIRRETGVVCIQNQECSSLHQSGPCRSAPPVQGFRSVPLSLDSDSMSSWVICILIDQCHIWVLEFTGFSNPSNFRENLLDLLSTPINAIFRPIPYRPFERSQYLVVSHLNEWLIFIFRDGKNAKFSLSLFWI